MSRRLVVAASSSQSDEDVYDVYDDDDDDQKPRAFLLCPPRGARLDENAWEWQQLF